MSISLAFVGYTAHNINMTSDKEFSKMVAEVARKSVRFADKAYIYNV